MFSLELEKEQALLEAPTITDCLRLMHSYLAQELQVLELRSKIANEAQSEMILGKWWQLAAAGTTMAILVTAFSLFTDALRDALDPKLK